MNVTDRVLLGNGGLVKVGQMAGSGSAKLCFLAGTQSITPTNEGGGDAPILSPATSIAVGGLTLALTPSRENCYSTSIMVHSPTTRRLVVIFAIAASISLSAQAMAPQGPHLTLKGPSVVIGEETPEPASSDQEMVQETLRNRDSQAKDSAPPITEVAPAETANPAASIVPQQSEDRPCVLLKNDNVLFGVAEQVGEFVVVRTGEAGEIQLSRSAVACWADSIRNLYRYRVDHRTNGDVTVHLRDARWCLRYDLFDLAAAELRLVRQIDPDNTQADSIEAQLRRQVAPPAQPSAATAAATVDSHSVGTQAEPVSDPVDPATLRRFASHIQPMLINRCGSCHQSTTLSSENGWAITLPARGSRASAEMTHANLASTLEFLDLDVPEASRLLLKATEAHGGVAAPLNSRNAKAIRSFEYWILTATTAMARKRDHRRVASRKPTPEKFGPREIAERRGADEELRIDDLPANAHTNVGPGEAEAFVAERETMKLQVGSSGSQSDEGPRRLPEVANPFDPDLFNRRFHPESGR